MKRKLINCKQSKCIYLILGKGCHVCETCKAEPYLIDENCDTCWNCSNDAGILRWDNGTPTEEQTEEEAEPEEEKPMEIIA